MDIVIQVHNDFVLIVSKREVNPIEIRLIFENHKFNCAFADSFNGFTMNKAYYFKHCMNVYNEPFNEDDYNNLLNKLKKFCNEKNYTFEIQDKKV